MARVLLGVTGGIAAYKACELIRLLVRDGEEVVPVPTAGAERFVRRTTFEALARRRVPDDIYPHLGEADLLAIAPLSANTMARLAAGLADNPVAEVALAFAGPVLVAPAMNSRMWEHPATQANAATLRARGIEMIGPAEGSLAEGEVGIGRMAEPGEIHLRVRALLASGSDRSLAGRSLTVTAGGTREALDTVRFIGNRSSGRMGVALARAAQRRGAHVTLVGANLSVVPPPGVRVVTVRSAAELARATSTTPDTLRYYEKAFHNVHLHEA
ncbi:MAG: bifunctional phosphopantothenoylcysteine decarboxylase/phosphopantothenate--cysteine ligase CoaBC, partial [Gaiellales bacterium]